MKKQTILFMVTNGAGLGHLTRGLAVAKRLRALCLNYEIIFFTTSLATEVIRNEGFMYFYMPTKSMLPEELETPKWMNMMYEQLQNIVDIYKPSAIVFDGAMPYSALINQINTHKQIKSIWIKRESYKPGWQGLSVYEQGFDLIIVPDEIGANRIGEEEKGNRKYCHAISLIDINEAHGRKQIRKAFGVKDNEKLYYIQLGAGMLNEIENLLEAVQREVLARKNTKIVIGESIIGKHIKTVSNEVQVIRNYPNAQYFNAFDFSISAAGYNTFHELVQFGIPTLFVPNTQTVVDDQVRRVRNLEEKNAVLQLKGLHELPSKIAELEKRESELTKQLKKYQTVNGAIEVAQFIVEILA